MSPWINYHHLYYFKTVAEEGTVSKAASKLLIGQPTLSAQLKQFEENLGVQLFERQHKKLVLTEQGKVALDYARSIFKMGSEMYEVLHDRIRPSKLALSIGALDTVAKTVILELVKDAIKVAPCQVTLVEGGPDELLRELTAHRVDLLLTNFIPSGTDAKGLVHRVLSKKNIAIYGAPKFRKLKKNFPHSIVDQPMVVPTYDSQLRYDLEHWSQTVGVTLNILVESQDIGVKKLLAAHGLGLLPAAAHTVTSQVQSGELVEIGELVGVYEELHLVSAQRQIENPVAKKLMQSFKL